VSAATEVGVQIAAAWAYYAGLVGMMRLSGKRLAGQTTSCLATVTARCSQLTG